MRRIVRNSIIQVTILEINPHNIGIVLVIVLLEGWVPRIKGLECV
jgi:hypothetical protein